MSIYSVVVTYTYLFFYSLIAFKFKPYGRWSVALGIRNFGKAYGIAIFYNAYGLSIYENFRSIKGVNIYISFKGREFIYLVLLVTIYIDRIALSDISVPRKGYGMTSLNLVKRAWDSANFFAVNIES